MKFYDIRTMNEQEIFDAAATHLLNQKVKSGNSLLSWYTDYDNDRQCAAGIFVPESERDGSIEGKSWQELARIGIVPENHHELVTELQHIHDGFEPEEWPEKLKALADELGLQYNY